MQPCVASVCSSNFGSHLRESQRWVNSLFHKNKLNEGSDRKLTCHLSVLHTVSCRSNTLDTLFKSSKAETKCVWHKLHRYPHQESWFKISSMRGQIRIRSAPYHYVYSSQKLKSKILHIHLLLICRRCFCAGEELSLVLWPCRCWPPWPTGSPLRTLENWEWSCFWCLWLKSEFLGTFHQYRLNKGSDQNLICPLKS